MCVRVMICSLVPIENWQKYNYEKVGWHVVRRVIKITEITWHCGYGENNHITQTWRDRRSQKELDTTRRNDLNNSWHIRFFLNIFSVLHMEDEWNSHSVHSLLTQTQCVIHPLSENAERFTVISSPSVPLPSETSPRAQLHVVGMLPFMSLT